MFGIGSYDVPSTGKKINGLQSRKNEFSLGWQITDQTNHYQINRNTKNKEITPKITNSITNHKPTPYHRQNYQPLHQPQYNEYFNPAEHQYVSPLQQPYLNKNKPYPQNAHSNHEYQNYPLSKEEELQKIMYEFDQKKSNKPPSNSTERRIPIKPKQSMKDIIYNNVGVSQQPYRKPSRNHNSASRQYSQKIGYDKYRN